MEYQGKHSTNGGIDTVIEPRAGFDPAT